jgi:hypothetical protein
MSTLQQVQEFFKTNQLTPQTFVQFKCNTEGIIKFLTSFMTSDPVAVFAIQQFFPFFGFSLETAFKLEKENLISLPGIHEIFIDKILTVLDHTKAIIQQLHDPLLSEIIPVVEKVAEESIRLPSKIFQFVQKMCRCELGLIQKRTGIKFQFGPENVIFFSGPEPKVLSAKEQLKILTDSIGIDRFPRRFTRGEIEITQRASFFLIFGLLRNHMDKIYHSVDLKRASFEMVGRNSDLLMINQEITRITESITTFHIDFSPSQLETWKSLISQNPDGLKGVYKTINSKCPVTMRFVDELSRLEIAGNRETIDQARQIIGDMINVNKVLFDFLSFSLTPQHSARA